ncbi:MAG: hypothetical protein Q8P81_00680 [Nanoarchaeota archaeon]|nr:hypothetical protein [Nanoarchaeota archaeon]
MRSPEETTSSRGFGRSDFSYMAKRVDSRESAQRNSSEGGLPFLAVVLSRGRDGNFYRSRAVVYGRGLIVDFLS